MSAAAQDLPTQSATTATITMACIAAFVPTNEPRSTLLTQATASEVRIIYMWPADSGLLRTQSIAVSRNLDHFPPAKRLNELREVVIDQSLTDIIPNDVSRDGADGLMERARPLGLVPSRALASPDGGIAVYFESARGRRYAKLVCYNDGEASLLLAEHGGPAIARDLSLDDVSLDDAVAEIASYLQ